MRRRGVLMSTNWISCSFICFCKCLFVRKPHRHDSDSSLAAIRGFSTSLLLLARCGIERGAGNRKRSQTRNSRIREKGVFQSKYVVEQGI